MSEFIYLDHNSTSPIDPSVVQTMVDCWRSGYVNPASQHQPGQLARRQLERYRLEIAEMLGARTSGMDADVLVFTSGGTESNNLALFGLAALGRKKLIQAGRMGEAQAAKVLISAVEHPAVFSAAEQLARLGYDVHRVPVDSLGVCQIGALSRMLDDRTALVSVMLANNETGVIQPVAEIAKLCRPLGCLCHTDAVQIVGKCVVDFAALDVDALSFTAHKFAGPRGIGGLLLRHGVSPEPMLFGGFQQMAMRPGTESVALVAGMWKALSLFAEDPISKHDFLLGMRNQLEHRLKSEYPDLVVNGGSVDRVPQTLNLSFPGIDRQTFMMAADMEKLAISTGSACASGSSELSPVLLAMGVAKETVNGSIRISFGYSNEPVEAEQAFDRIKRMVDRRR